MSTKNTIVAKTQNPTIKQTKVVGDDWKTIDNKVGTLMGKDVFNDDL